MATLNKKQMKKISDYLENQLDCEAKFFDVDEFSYVIECYGCKNIAGEDWCIAINLSKQDINSYGLKAGFRSALREVYEEFDVDEDVRIWADTAGNGCTPGFRRLVENAEYKEGKLYQLWHDAHSSFEIDD